ncbi:MAG: DUF5056 domain-containing protein [Rikenellaceae bacterium]|nr:DUF5056 domain-containing protein [Rikenellaceae bacterium]
MNDSEQDKLISKFLKENRFEVENIDFSRKVMRKIRRGSPKLISYISAFVGGVVSCSILFLFDGKEVVYKIFKKFVSLWLSTADEILLMSETKLIISLIGIVITLIVVAYQLKSDYKFNNY